MKIRYVGPLPSVSVPLPDGTVVEVQRNHQAEFNEETARALARQEDWERVQPPKADDKGTTSS